MAAFLCNLENRKPYAHRLGRRHDEAGGDRRLHEGQRVFALYVFAADVDAGFVRADFAVPVTVSKTKKTLDIWINLWFDKSNVHFNARNEGVGAAVLEAFK